MLSASEITLGLESNNREPWDLSHHVSSMGNSSHYKDILVLLIMTALIKGFVN